MKIGIIGNGFVGRATLELSCKDIDILVYDINPELCIPANTKFSDLMKCKIIFISVPTPMNKDGSCYLTIVEDVINNLKSLKYSNFIVIRSTVPVGTCDKLNCYFMPEFLTEKNYINDFINNKEWIFGILGHNRDIEFKDSILELFNLAYKNNKIKSNKLTFMFNKEAELVKMFRNCFLATKVSFCNEIYEFCQNKNICYENVRKIASNDDRIIASHTYVPGPDGEKGYGGTCFPKDTNSFKYEMEKAGMKSYILNAVIDRNENVDRPQKDWKDKKGRAVIY